MKKKKKKGADLHRLKGNAHYLLYSSLLFQWWLLSDLSVKSSLEVVEQEKGPLVTHTPAPHSLQAC